MNGDISREERSDWEKRLCYRERQVLKDCGEDGGTIQGTGRRPVHIHIE